MRTEGMLVLARTEGRSIYIGREVTVSVERVGLRGLVVLFVKGSDQVMGPRVAKCTGGTRVELMVGEAASVAPTVRVTLLAIQSGKQVRLGIEAPRWMAISRDDVTMAEHNEWQERRERRAAR